GPKAQIRDSVRELISGARALSRLVQDPPRPETTVVQVTQTPRWVVVCVVVATSASVGALVLSLWSFISG
ncbi:MAG: 2-polyprenylphenol 6-hydroxylase, partial [Brevundimonas sp.]|nr:2-polyprenylphenol 6-hydroxylase [Brevundimonas sp.]